MIQIQGIDQSLKSPLTADLDFAKYKAIALVCDKGATMPASPTDGQWYLHTPTGRNVLYQYNSEWIPIISVGSMTVYVDKTDGTDDLNHGTAVDAAAFATVQYAVDCIPGLVGGNVTININDENPAENVVVQGKSYTADFTITINGTLTQLATGTIESAVQGTGATQGSITDTGQFTGYANKLLYANGEYRVIDSVTADVATICGCFTGVPSGTWVVYDWGTIVGTGAGIAIALIKQGSVIINDISMTSTAYSFSSANYSDVTLNRCKLAGAQPLTDTYSSAKVYYSYLASTSISWLNSSFCTLATYGCKATGASAYGLYGTNKSSMIVQAGTVVDGATNGIKIANTSYCNVVNIGGTGYNRVRNCTIGILGENGGVIINAALLTQFAGNGADISPLGTSDPVYIV